MNESLRGGLGNAGSEDDAALTESDQMFRGFADAIPQLAWMADGDGAIFWYNRRWYEFTGTTPAQMAGWGWQSVHDPRELPLVLEQWKTSIATGQPFEMEFPLRSAAGDFRWFLTRVSPVRDAEGRVVRWFGTNTDVHDVRVTREALARGEERLRVALAAARMGTYEWSTDTGVLHWSDQTARLHGIEPQQFRGTFEHARELTHPEDHVRVVHGIAEATANGRDFELEYRVIHPGDGSVHWLYAYGRAVPDDGAGRARTIGAVLDITERKRIEDALRTSAETSQTLNEVGKVIAAELDLEKLVQFVTDAATRLTRAQFGAFFYNVITAQGEAYTLYTISGVPREAFSKFPMPRNTAIFKPTFEGTAVVRSDDITKDPRYGKSAPHFGMPRGHLPVLSYLAVPVISRSGEVLGGLFFGHPEPGIFGEQAEELVRGLAAQAAVAIDNARLFRRAQEAIHLRDEFLSIASHELKTPLTPLRMQMQSLRNLVESGGLQRATPERLQKLSDICERQVVRLTTLVDNLLDVARINAGKLSLSLERINLVPLVQETMERYAGQFAAAGCETSLQAPPHLEATVDPLRIEQALVNLLTNAIKYAPKKPIEVAVSQEADRAVLTVRDHGEGIADADRERIFKRYERVGSTANVGGLGLGLFITRQIADAHGGSVQVESAPGQGAAFTIRVPLRPES
jgi:PAS domain S-box-containing protein